jgi:hypothetical protein
LESFFINVSLSLSPGLCMTCIPQEVGQEMLRLVRDLVSSDLCKVGNLCSLEAEADISNGYLLV